MDPTTLLDRIRPNIRRERLLETAIKLCGIPSPTGNAGAACDALADMLRADGFTVERDAGGHSAAPAVMCRFDSGQSGKCLQFNGHLDVVHLPFVSPTVDGNLLRGSGACDMKGGTAAAIEALRALRDGRLLERGSILLVAHDLHEAPWGLGEQLDNLIRRGIHGDAVLIPEPLNQNLPIIGRGSATWKVSLWRYGPPVHEVMRTGDEPSVIAAGAAFVQRLALLDQELANAPDSPAGRASVFIGQIHSGEIYNQHPQECKLEGTRRWLPGADPIEIEREFRSLTVELANNRGINADIDWFFIRGAFELKADDPFVHAFQECHAAISGSKLQTGPKPFVDDGNSFSSLAKIPAITHGPRAGGQHTVNEWVDINDLVRVATLYAMTAVTYLHNRDGCAT